MARKYRKFKDDLRNDLKNKKYAEAFLKVAMEDYRLDGDEESFITAIRLLAEAKGGLGELSKSTKSKRQTIYNALSKDGNPRLSTLNEILQSLGFRLSVEPLPRKVA